MKYFIAVICSVFALLLVPASASALNSQQAWNMLTGNSVTWAPDNDIQIKANQFWTYQRIDIVRAEAIPGLWRSCEIVLGVSNVVLSTWNFYGRYGGVWQRTFYAYGSNASNAHDGEKINPTC